MNFSKRFFAVLLVVFISGILFAGFCGECSGCFIDDSCCLVNHPKDKAFVDKINDLNFSKSLFLISSFDYYPCNLPQKIVTTLDATRFYYFSSVYFLKSLRL